jgi:hypothetical protein
LVERQMTKNSAANKKAGMKPALMNVIVRSNHQIS